MRIGIDARELGGRVTGVGRFLAGLLREWSTAPGAERHQFVLYAHEPLTVGLNPARFDTRLVAGAPGTWWEQVRLPPALAADRLDVFFAPAYTAPLRVAVPLVAAIYDLSYVAHPEWFRLREGVRRRWLTRQTAARSRIVITLSAFSKGEIVERLGVDRDRVRVVVPGVDRLGVTAEPRAEPRVLYAGSLFNRRHVPDLIRAVATLSHRRPGVSLDIVGDNRTFPHEDIGDAIARAEAGNAVRWHRYVTDEALLALYGKARAFAFLSEYEGLGLTPLEALGAGIPPVVFDTAVARESLGEAALYVPVGDTMGIERALERALFDEAARAAVLSAAPLTLARYDWPRAARETLEALEMAASTRRD